MSRSRKGGKGPGHEYWSRRPNSMSVPGRDSKKRTHRLERLQDKAIERHEDSDLRIEYCYYCGEGYKDLDNQHYCWKCNMCPEDCEC